MALALPVMRFFPETPNLASNEDEPPEILRFMTASPEGRIVAHHFGSIESRDTRRAVATIVEALATR